jgi:hypothetical protein
MERDYRREKTDLKHWREETRGEMMQMEKQKEKGGRGRGSSFHMSLKPNTKRKAAQRNKSGSHISLSLCPGISNNHLSCNASTHRSPASAPFAALRCSFSVHTSDRCRSASSTTDRSDSSNNPRRDTAPRPRPFSFRYHGAPCTQARPSFSPSIRECTPARRLVV